MSPRHVTSPDHPALAELCARLAAGAAEVDASGLWPAEQLRLCGEYGVYRWFADEAWGGYGWSADDVLRGYAALAEACLTTTFILTQRTGACQRIEGSENELLKARRLPDLVSGASFATVGISHLTTSRRYLAQPPLRAHAHGGGWRLSGFSPWITGAMHADCVVVGAAVMDGDRPTDEQMLLAVPTDLPGVACREPARLVALSASATGQVDFDQVELASEHLLAGPAENVMARGVGGGTGGLQTSALAVGLTRAAVRWIEGEAKKRPDLQPVQAALVSELDEVAADLFAAAAGESACSNDEIRGRANNLALRSTQAALAAAKGAGYMADHPASRWCREALFFLVWSCPQPVVSAHLCELAGLTD
jgi:alkylation response protein AidB-like acyl-CoA dehydrogenase